MAQTKMSHYLLKTLSTKSEIDQVIRSTEDVVLILRFGRDEDPTCMQMDHIVSKIKTEVIRFRDHKNTI